MKAEYYVVIFTAGQEALLAEYEMREEAMHDMVAELELLRNQTESQR